METIDFWTLSPINPSGHNSLELYDYQSAGVPKRFWSRNEFEKTAEYLDSIRESLKSDFLRGFSTVKEAIETRNIMEMPDQRDTIEETMPRLSYWKSLWFHYQHPRLNTSNTVTPKHGLKFPTAYKLAKKYGNDCALATYSILSPQSSIPRHTDPENRDNDFLRIHIPLIIPAGDVFLEVLGEEKKWDDIFAIDGQLVHSAHNFTDEYRVIFLIDIRRTILGVPPGEVFNPEWQLHAKTFQRQSHI